MGCYRLLLDVITIFILSESLSYDLQCPDSSQWRFRSKKCESVENSNYQCLFEVQKAKLKEYCGGNEMAREGFKYELNPNPDQVGCSSSRYQPFSFTSLSQSLCEYEKSTCNEEGQVVADNGTTISDRTCRCDFTRKYVFVTPPKNRCYCTPLEEDCSCYKSSCPKDKPIMLADYRCVDTHPIQEQIMCTEIKSIRRKRKSEDEHTIKDGKLIIKREVPSIVPVLFCCMLGLLLIMIYTKPKVRYTYVEAVFTSKGKDNMYTVLEGDSIIIHASVKSCLPIKKTTWRNQKLGDLPINDKYRFTQIDKNNPSLEIKNFTENDQGSYKCNANDWFEYLCFPWLTEANQDSKQDVVTIKVLNLKQRERKYRAHVGRDFTFATSQIGEEFTKKLVRIGDNGKPTSTSDGWTINNFNKSHTGTYLCIVINSEGSIADDYCFKANLKVIDKDNCQQSIEKHRQNKLYVRISAVDKVVECLGKTKLVLVSGREGSGKSSLCVEIAAWCFQVGICPFKIETFPIKITELNNGNVIYIIDNIKLDTFDQYLWDLITRIESTPQTMEMKMLATCDKNDFMEIKEMLNNTNHKFQCVDLDSSLELKEKRKIMEIYMTENKIGQTSKSQDNHLDFITIEKRDVQVTISQQTVSTILNSQPWFGFPLTIQLFCRDRVHLHYGGFFNYPPMSVAEEIKKIYQTARNGNDEEIINKLCVLVYIFVTENHQFVLKDFESKKCKAILSKFKININPPIELTLHSVKRAANSMVNQFLSAKGDIYEFIHPLLAVAILYAVPCISSELLIADGTINDIIKFIKKNLFVSLEDRGLGGILELDPKLFDSLCKRLVKEFCQNHEKKNQVGEYMWTWIKYRDEQFRSKLIDSIEHFRFKPERCDKKRASVVYEKQNISPTFSVVDAMSLITMITNEGSEMWIYESNTSDFMLLCGMLVALKDDYSSKRGTAFKILWKQFNEKCLKRPFVDVQRSAMDNDGTTFLQYLARYSENNSSVYEMIIELLAGVNK